MILQDNILKKHLNKDKKHVLFTQNDLTVTKKKIMNSLRKLKQLKYMTHTN